MSELIGCFTLKMFSATFDGNVEHIGPKKIETFPSNPRTGILLRIFQPADRWVSTAALLSRGSQSWYCSSLGYHGIQTDVSQSGRTFYILTLTLTSLILQLFNKKYNFSGPECF